MSHLKKAMWKFPEDRKILRSEFLHHCDFDTGPFIHEDDTSGSVPIPTGDYFQLLE